MFPHRNIGPLMLRRIFMSCMQEIASSDHEEFHNWDSLHAALANTSPEVLQKNYNRWNNRMRPQQTLTIINDKMKLNPTDELAAIIDGHAEGVTYLTNVAETIMEVLDERFVDKEHQYLCKLQDGSEEWIASLLLDPYEEVVLKYFDACENKNTDKNNNVPGLESDSVGSEEDADDMIVDEEQTAIVEAVNAVDKPTRKRKHSAKILYEVVLNNKEVVKPGDVVSVFPEDDDVEHWVAKVVSISNDDMVYVQWLNQQKGNPNRYTRIAHYDEIDVGAIKAFMPGRWQTLRVFVV